MPTTMAGRQALEKAWRDISNASSGDPIQRAIALSLLSIALSLRVVAANFAQGKR